MYFQKCLDYSYCILFYSWYFRGLISPADISTESAGMVSLHRTVLDDIQIWNEMRMGDGSGILWGGHISDKVLTASQTGFSGFDHFINTNDATLVIFAWQHFCPCRYERSSIHVNLPMLNYYVFVDNTFIRIKDSKDGGL